MCIRDSDRISQGFQVIQQAMIPYCRARDIRFEGTGFFPNTRLYAFFDGKPISVYCLPDDGFQDSSVTIPAVGSQLVSDAVGDIKGVFKMPDPKNSDNPKYQTGEIVFRLTSSINDTKSTQPATAGEAVYNAVGTLNTVQETIFATRNADVVRASVNQSTATFDTVTNTIVSTINYDWNPPPPPVEDWGDGDGDDGGDGPPECVLDCPGLDDFDGDTELCQWLVDIFPEDSCFEDCDEETYNKMMSSLKSVNLDYITEYQDLSLIHI